MPFTINDGVMNRLSNLTGTSNDRIRQWLITLSPAPSPETMSINDLWRSVCDDGGFTDGGLNAQITAYMKDAIPTAATSFNDVQLVFWNGPVIP
jgi:hypothetical protein